MKIFLLQPLGDLVKPGGWVRNCFVEPIGLEYVAGAAIGAGHSVRLCHPIEYDREFITELSNYSPDVIGYSAYSYSFNQAKDWAKLAKQLFPNVINVFGGYHASAAPSEVVLNSYIDYAIVGEGEDAFVKLLTKLENGIKSPEIPGVAYLNINGNYTFVKSQRVKNPDCLASPVRDSSLLSRTKSHQILYPPPSKQKALAQVIYSRGCCYSCEFCASQSIWGQKVYWHSPQNVIQEIEALAAKYGTNLVFFSDVSMASDHDKLRLLCEELIRRDLPVYWWGMYRIDELTPELLKMMKQAKATKITVGIESCEEHIFQKVKNSNLCWDGTYRILNIAHDLGFIVRGTLMLDFPNVSDSYYSLFATFLKDLPLDEIRLSYCTPFPGTAFWKKYCEDSNEIELALSTLTTNEPIYCSGGLGKEDLFNLRRELANIFYGSLLYEDRVRKKVLNFPHLAQSYGEYFCFASKNDTLDLDIANNLCKVVKFNSNCVVPSCL